MDAKVKNMKPQVSVIIPAREESESIISTLTTLEDVVVSYEIIVVSDAISDRDMTEQVVETYARTHKQVRLLPKDMGRDRDGFSHALERGVYNARAPYVVFVMADLCDDPKTIDVMYAKVILGYDAVCASRYMRGGKKIGGPRVQGICSQFVNAVLHRFAHISTSDATNAFKMYKTTLARKLEYGRTIGVETSLSLFLQSRALGAKTIDVPTVWNGRIRGTSKFKFLPQFLRYSRILLAAMI